MMLTPSEKPSFEMSSAAIALGDSVIRASDDMIEFMFHDVKLTLYQNGSIMFYHFTDFDIACSYADDVIGLISGM